MAINWAGLEAQLTIIHNSDNGYDTSDVAQAISDAYISAVNTATESRANNTLLALNPTAISQNLLKVSIENSLTTAVGTFGQVFNINLVDSGLTATWMGATFNPVFPATPEQATVVSISVLNGGVGSPQTPPTASNSNVDWVNMWINYFKSHADTVSGSLIGASSVPSPVTVLFTGIL